MVYEQDAHEAHTPEQALTADEANELITLIEDYDDEIHEDVRSALQNVAHEEENATFTAEQAKLVITVIDNHRAGGEDDDCGETLYARLKDIAGQTA